MDRRLILEKQDMTHLSWARYKGSPGTPGTFLKAYSELGGRKTYYKLSDYNTVRGLVGHECVNELIVDRLLDILGVEHLQYQLIHADVVIDDRLQEVYLSASEDFKRRSEDKTALEVIYELETKKQVTPLEYCVSQGWGSYIYEMLVVDYLILNRDRHGANIEVLRNKKKKTLRLAPLFDHGLSLLCFCHSDAEAEAYDVMEDKPVNAFIGGNSTKNNLDLIPAEEMPVLQPLLPDHENIIMEGLETVISETLRHKIWEMIWKRWCNYENLRHTRRI